MPDKEQTMEIFEQIRMMREALGRIDVRTKMSAAAREDFESRLKALEFLSAKASGVLWAAGIVITFVGAGISWLLQVLFRGSN